jgi:hypothetical protein
MIHVLSNYSQVCVKCATTFIYSTTKITCLITIVAHHPPQYRAIHTYRGSLRHARMSALNTLVFFVVQAQAVVSSSGDRPSHVCNPERATASYWTFQPHHCHN